jgi:hypothetical protein
VDLPVDLNLISMPQEPIVIGRTLVFWARRDGWLRLRDWATRFGITVLGDAGLQDGVELFDAPTGRRLGFVRGWFETVHGSADGTRLATMDPTADGRTLLIWDIPPRKSLTWFAITAGFLLTAACLWALWRSRRIRRNRPSIPSGSSGVSFHLSP